MLEGDGRSFDKDLLKEIVFIPSDCEERVKASLELLPEEVKELLLDRIVGRMSLEEVADKYGITKGKGTAEVIFNGVQFLQQENGYCWTNYDVSSDDWGLVELKYN